MNLVDLEWKQQNENSLATIGLDTAENEPSKVCYMGLAPYASTAWIPHSQPRYHGDVIKFSGDALTIFFRACEKEESLDHDLFPLSGCADVQLDPDKESAGRSLLRT